MKDAIIILLCKECRLNKVFGPRIALARIRVLTSRRFDDDVDALAHEEDRAIQSAINRKLEVAPVWKLKSDASIHH